MSIVLQNIPGLAALTLAMMGIFALPMGFHRLATGEYRKTGLDNWDYILEQRDKRLRKEAKERRRRQLEEEGDN